MHTMTAFLLMMVTVALAQGSLRFTAPRNWVAKPLSSAMRVAEYSLPKAADDTEGADVAVFFFGGQGGSVEANIERWLNQMAQPDGRPSSAVAKTSTMTANGLNLTLLDVSGRYVAETQPGSSQRLDKTGFRMIAAVVETHRGPYFVKITGPQKTVEHWHTSVMDFLKSMRLEE